MLVRSIILLIACLMLSPAYAVPDFLQRWSAFYPDSNSDEIACQLCHQRVDGGDGWNGYGFDVRNNYIELGRVSIEQAFIDVEQLNSDVDENQLSNIQEIDQALYPGWVNSNTNTIFFSDFTGLINQPAPFQEPEPVIGPILPQPEPPIEEDSNCFPIVASNGRFALICL